MTQGDLVALDPSIVSPGVAVFRDGGLYACCRLQIPASKDNHATRCIVATTRIIQWLDNQHANPRAVAYEWPQIYSHDSPAVANAVLYMIGVDLALTAGLSARAALLGVHSYLPAEVWGSLPKSKTGSAFESPRGRRIASRLTAAEFAMVPDQHDAIDAVGIGLHALGRLGIRRAPYQSSL